MKKLFAAVLVTVAVLSAPAQAGLVELAVMQGVTLYAVSKSTTPHPIPYHLTDACKPKSVQAVNGNYFYTSYEHCLKEGK